MDARVTTSRDIFDEQFENHQLLSYQAPVFRALVDAGAGDETYEPDDYASLTAMLVSRR
ncbi:MAG: hypothetical protein R3C45_02140 [Phycisphaerales bacterium]